MPTREVDELSYLAGIFDGEGNINICMGVRKSRGYDCNYFDLRLNVANRYKPVLDQFKQYFGGAVNKNTRYSSKHSVTYTWKVTAKAARKALEILYPYLRIKREAAQLGLQSILLVKKHPAKVTDKELEQRRALKEAISQINTKVYN
jgi:hypothetical protein